MGIWGAGRQGGSRPPTPHTFKESHSYCSNLWYAYWESYFVQYIICTYGFSSSSTNILKRVYSLGKKYKTNRFLKTNINQTFRSSILVII